MAFGKSMSRRARERGRVPQTAKPSVGNTIKSQKPQQRATSGFMGRAQAAVSATRKTPGAGRGTISDQASSQAMGKAPSRGGIMSRAKAAITARKASQAPSRGSGMVGNAAQQATARTTAPSRGAGMLGKVAQQARGKMAAVAGNTGATNRAARGAPGPMRPNAARVAGGLDATRVDGGGKVHQSKISKGKAEWRSGNRLHAKRTGKSKVR